MDRTTMIFCGNLSCRESNNNHHVEDRTTMIFCGNLSFQCLECMKTDLKQKLIQEHGIYSLCDVQAYLLCFFSSNSTLNVLYLQYYMPREESNKQDKKMRISLLVQKRRVLESLFLRHSESLFLPHSGVFVYSTLLHSF